MLTQLALSWNMQPLRLCMAKKVLGDTAGCYGVFAVCPSAPTASTAGLSHERSPADDICASDCDSESECAAAQPAARFVHVLCLVVHHLCALSV